MIQRRQFKLHVFWLLAQYSAKLWNPQIIGTKWNSIVSLLFQRGWFEICSRKQWLYILDHIDGTLGVTALHCTKAAAQHSGPVPLLQGSISPCRSRRPREPWELSRLNGEGLFGVLEWSEIVPSEPRNPHNPRNVWVNDPRVDVHPSPPSRMRSVLFLRFALLRRTSKRTSLPFALRC